MKPNMATKEPKSDGKYKEKHSEDAAAQKKKKFFFTPAADLALLREILNVRPFVG